MIEPAMGFPPGRFPVGTQQGFVVGSRHGITMHQHSRRAVTASVDPMTRDCLSDSPQLSVPRVEALVGVLR